MLVLRTLAVFTLVLTLSVAGATPGDASHAWSTYHWGRTANPFTLQVGDNMSSAWDAHLVTAAGDWGASGSNITYDSSHDTHPHNIDASANPLRTTVVAGGTNPRRCRPTSGRIEVCNATYGSNGWLGLAQIWLSGGHIVQGVAKMNDTYFNLAKYNNPNEKLHVVCQEIGHTFGLGHTSEDGSSQDTCMDYFSNTDANATSTRSTRPNQHDYDQLAAIYSHLDSSNTYKSGAAAGAPGPAAAPGLRDDGTPVGASPARGDVYVTALGAGRFVVTFITWAR